MSTMARGAAPGNVRLTNPLGPGSSAASLIQPVRPGGVLPASVDEGLGYLQFLIGEHDEILARALFAYSLRRSSRRSVPFEARLSFAVRNRRKRAARLWVNALLGGDVRPQTLRTIAGSLVPQLAGTGPDAWRATTAGRDFVDHLLGSATAMVMDRPRPCLIRHAKALHALESILALQLGAILAVGRIAERPPALSPAAP